MNGITVFMALVDYLPVIFFFLAALLLQNDLYSKLSKTKYTLLAAGSLMVLIGGTLKATWKILYALSICDFQALDVSFFPFQGIGFLLVFLSLTGICTKKFNTKALSIVPLYLSNMPFIILQVIGCAGAQFMLIAKSLQMKKKSATALYVIAFIFMLGMGYLGAKFDDSSNMHWLAQCTNIISQLSFLAGTWILHKSGLAH
ncbi:MAG: hypothetical protein IJC38_08815 [Erysipelotrichaceae bacterium]|nr:hypothetical protein [Erysipelotrichaceae bacterium]